MSTSLKGRVLVGDEHLANEERAGCFLSLVSTSLYKRDGCIFSFRSISLKKRSWLRSQFCEHHAKEEGAGCSYSFVSTSLKKRELFSLSALCAPR